MLMSSEAEQKGAVLSRSVLPTLQKQQRMCVHNMLSYVAIPGMSLCRCSFPVEPGTSSWSTAWVHVSDSVVPTLQIISEIPSVAVLWKETNQYCEQQQPPQANLN